jgi:hypothetical protein
LTTPPFQSQIIFRFLVYTIDAVTGGPPLGESTYTRASACLRPVSSRRLKISHETTVKAIRKTISREHNIPLKDVHLVYRQRVFSALLRRAMAGSPSTHDSVSIYHLADIRNGHVTGDLVVIVGGPPDILPPATSGFLAELFYESVRAESMLQLTAEHFPCAFPTVLAELVKLYVWEWRPIVIDFGASAIAGSTTISRFHSQDTSWIPRNLR